MFEPIVDMLSNKVIGYEGLCKSESPNINAEVFFKSLTANEHLILLSLQLQKFQKWVEQHPELYQGRQLFLNINQELLLDNDFPRLFIPYNNYYPIALELEPQYPLTHSQCSAIKKLTNMYGIPVWFDDYIDGMQLVKHEFWSGIKLERHFFWSLISENKKILDPQGDFSATRLICEGIETSLEKKSALALGARYGQGHLWPAVG